MDKHYVKGKIPNTEGHVLYDFIYINVQNWQIHREESRSVVARACGKGEREVIANWYGISF